MRCLLVTATAVLALASCGDDFAAGSVKPDEEHDKTARCRAERGGSEGDRFGSVTSALAVQDRKVMGAAPPYVPDLSLAARDQELASSIAARRAAAWEVVARVLAPVPLAEPALAERFGGQPTVPAWHTWYGRDDFERVFKRLYAELGPSGRRTRAPFGGAAIAAGLAWNAQALDDLPSWPEERYQEYLEKILTQEDVHGVGEAGRVGYSHGTLTHLLASYGATLSCRNAPDPEPFARAPTRASRDVRVREDITVDDCGWQGVGPFQVAQGGTLSVDSAGRGDIDVYVRRGAPPTPFEYDCKSDGGDASERCEVAGSGPIYVAAFGASPGAATLRVEYLEADVREPACLGEPMPADAVVVKADWKRAQFGELLPVFDTSGPRLRGRLSEARPTWGAGDGAQDPGADRIYTARLPLNDAVLRLDGLHIMSKELEHWMWITLWWSAQPDTDFGADRPAAIAALPGPWRNYKMCVTTAYPEGDPDPRGGFSGSLGDALAAVYRGVGAPTWCSNPYIELGEGNAATNCIGCHQHGGTSLTAERILAEEPRHGTTRVRNNFFTDYLWAIKGGGGEDLAALIQNEVDYWESAD